MRVQFTCADCGSGIEVLANANANKIRCDICGNEQSVTFDSVHEVGDLENCPCCQRKDFYKQKDFNRKIGVILYVIAAAVSPWTYYISLFVAFLIDVKLFRKLGNVAVCYNCNTNFRDVRNINDIADFDHEMNDRIIYSGHEFGGKQLGK